MADTKDKYDEPMNIGDRVRYDMSLDTMEQMYGEVPDRHDGTEATLTSVSGGGLVTHITFDGDPKRYKVSRLALVKVMKRLKKKERPATPAVPPAPLNPKPGPTPTPDAE